MTVGRMVVAIRENVVNNTRSATSPIVDRKLIRYLSAGKRIVIQRVLEYFQWNSFSVNFFPENRCEKNAVFGLKFLTSGAEWLK